MKRGQGLPLNTIVLAALAVLVLLLIVGFTTGSLGRLFEGFRSQTTTVDLKTAKTLCTEYCTELKSEGAAGTLTIEKAEKSEYATKRFAIDFNRNGRIDDNEINVPCWDPRIGVLCQVIIGTSEEKYVCKPGYGVKCSDADGKSHVCESIGCSYDYGSGKCTGSVDYDELRRFCSSKTSETDCVDTGVCIWDSEHQDVYYICQPYGDRFECRRR